MNEQLKKDKDKILDILAEDLKQRIKFIMSEAGKEFTDKEAENVLNNIAIHLMAKNKDI